MLIGLIGDTHGLLRPEVHGELAGVELILHADVIVYGHTHVGTVTRVKATLVVNRGAARPRRFDLAASVARMLVEAGRATVEVLELGA